mmetsp:Transcript_96407/g.254621  ORF Transcript_96407/g.254621 Transcript_96407/m.254621 type:complete len:298 (-) Transcript_96407:889-1782(-)
MWRGLGASGRHAAALGPPEHERVHGPDQRMRQGQAAREGHGAVRRDEGAGVHAERGHLQRPYQRVWAGQSSGEGARGLGGDAVERSDPDRGDLHLAHRCHGSEPASREGVGVLRGHEGEPDRAQLHHLRQALARVLPEPERGQGRHGPGPLQGHGGARHPGGLVHVRRPDQRVQGQVPPEGDGALRRDATARGGARRRHLQHRDQRLRPERPDGQGRPGVLFHEAAGWPVPEQPRRVQRDDQCVREGGQDPGRRPGAAEGDADDGPRARRCDLLHGDEALRAGPPAGRRPPGVRCHV